MKHRTPLRQFEHSVSARPLRSVSSRRGGCLSKCLLFLTMTAVLGVLAWVFLLPSIVTRMIESRSGFAVSVSSLKINPLTARLAIDGLVISNPPELFNELGFVQIRSLHADAELASLFTDRLVIEEAIVDIDRITLVRNAKNQNNGVLFGQRMQGEKPAQTAEKPAPVPQKPSAESGKDSSVWTKNFLIRRMKLRLDKVVLVDDTGSKPETREVNLAFAQDYENVTTPVEIATPIILQVAANDRSFSKFAGDLGRDVVEGAKKAGQKIKEAGGKAGDTIKDIWQSISDKVKE